MVGPHAAVPVGYTDSHLLLVDDEAANIRLLERLLLYAGFEHLQATSDPRAAVPLFTQFQPDLVLLDLHMPVMDGFAVMEQLRSLTQPETYLPILVLTADSTYETRTRALALGATDFLTKPFDSVEVLLRITNLLRTRALHLQIARQNELLEARVRERTAELEATRSEVLERLARAVEFRDDQTHAHTLRVGDGAASIATTLGLPASEVELIWRAAPLHDIGKIGTPDHILLKPGELTEAESAIMREHTILGAQMLANGRTALVRMAEQLALTHHERWDGGGYPAGLAGSQIPLISRIVSVADVFDALTHVRPYKRAWTADEAVAEISSQSGRQFDPEVVAAFVARLGRRQER